MRKDLFLQFTQLLALVGTACLMLYFVTDNEIEVPSHSSSVTSPSQQFDYNLEHRPYHQLIQYDADRSSPGVTLVGVNEAQEVLLLSHDGKILNSWQIDTDRAILQPDTCHLFSIHGTVLGAKNEPWRTLRNTVREYSWDGRHIWSYTDKDILHHDIRQLHDGDILTLARRRVRYQGPEKFDESFLMRSDAAIIVGPNRKINWEWNISDSVSHSECGIRECPTAEEAVKSRAEQKRLKDWSDMNTVTALPENKWFSLGHEAFRPGNILVHVRNFWQSMIVDRNSKSIVWKFPTKKEFYSSPELQIRGGHESHMIPEGLPGAGNILILDNGHVVDRPYSRVLEIDPVKRTLVWSYTDEANFFTRTAGAVQRLENGNTLISEDLRGNVFEVTPSGERVWQVHFPYRTARAKRYLAPKCASLLESPPLPQKPR